MVGSAETRIIPRRLTNGDIQDVYGNMEIPNRNLFLTERILLCFNKNFTFGNRWSVENEQLVLIPSAVFEFSIS